MKKWMNGWRKKKVQRRAAVFLLAGMFTFMPAAGREAVLASKALAAVESGPYWAGRQGSFEVNRFVLPEEARVLVVVEGTGGISCQVYAYERVSPDSKVWTLRVNTPGNLGNNGMSNHRTVGDKTTPIGLFQLNTPFGQADPLEGFPENYVKVTDSYVWEDDTNRLEKDSQKEGERVGTARYAGYYDYVLDAGYNKNAVEPKGAALFLHCYVREEEGTSGCVAIARDQMAVIMRLYGTYGDGACYIAQAPEGTFHQVYDTYGVNNGLSPEGEF